MDAPGRHYVRWTKPAPKGQIPYDLLMLGPWSSQIHTARKKGGAQGLGWEEGGVSQSVETV